MNICIIAPRYPYKDNMDFVFVKNLVDEWAKMGHTCVVITPFPILVYLRRHIKYRPRKYTYIVDDREISVYNPRSISLPGCTMLNRLFEPVSEKNTIEYLLKSINIKFDFIYCHFFGSSLMVFRYSLNSNIPLFVASGESEIPHMYKPYATFDWQLYRQYTKGVISVSTKNKEEAYRRGLIQKDKCKVFPNGTDLTRFTKKDKLACRKKLDLPENKFIIICVGYFCERKGQNRLLAAIKKLSLPDVGVVFLGKPAPVEGINLDDDSILYCNNVNNTDLPDFLNSADVFCLPTQHEGCCNAIIEAMACGLAIISSDRPFNLDILNSKNSILVDPDSIQRIADAIYDLYKDADLRELLGQQAYKDAQSLGIKQRARNILKFIEDKINI